VLEDGIIYLNKGKMKKRKDYILLHTWENEEHVRCSSVIALRRWIKEYSGYDGEIDFRERTGSDLRSLVGVWFFIVHDRIYLHK
jgi:hypothetical protein